MQWDESFSETVCAPKRKVYIQEKQDVGEIVEKLKKEYNQESKTLDSETRHDYKRKRHVPMKETPYTLF